MLRYFEDFSAGEIFTGGPLVVDRDEVVAFARRFDPQPFHLSDEGAQETYFGRLAASGWHTCSMTMAMMISGWGGGDNPASLGSPGVDELRWLKPVYPGDTLRVEMEILSTTPSRSKPYMGSVNGRVTTYNQDDVPVLRFLSIGLYRRREA